VEYPKKKTKKSLRIQIFLTWLRFLVKKQNLESKNPNEKEVSELEFKVAMNSKAARES